MSRRFSLGALVLAAAMALACGPRLAPTPRDGGAQARNQDQPRKKKPSQPRPLVAPPPAYGNKIVHGVAAADDSGLDG